MTNEEILEGDKLIAKFMEYIYLHDFNYPEENEIGWYNNDGIYCGKELKFHSSYDWIHPVVAKIFEIMKFKMTDECTDFENNLFRIICDMNYITPVEEVFGICVEYVKWYNEQNN